MQKLNESNFLSVVQSSNQLVLVKFTADWCQPCKAIEPSLLKLEKFMKNTSFFKVDVDESPAIAERYNIRSIPTLLLFRNGALFSKLQGMNNENSIRMFIESAY